MAFAIAQYGGGEEFVFTTSCKNDTLLHAIKNRCSCQSDMMIDLCDERGYLKKLSQNLADYADKFLNQRTKYVVVGVEKLPDGDVSIKPLLHEEHLPPDFSKYTERSRGRADSNTGKNSRLKKRLTNNPGSAIGSSR